VGEELVGSTSVLCYRRLGSSVAALWSSSRGRKYVMVYMHPKIGNAEETVDGRYPSNQIEERGGRSDKNCHLLALLVSQCV
jgi:hypothetical protein